MTIIARDRCQTYETSSHRQQVRSPRSLRISTGLSPHPASPKLFHDGGAYRRGLSLLARGAFSGSQLFSRYFLSTASGGWVFVIVSACRCTSFHSPFSRRKVLDTRRSKDARSCLPATFARHRSTS